VQELLAIRASSELFRLETADQVQQFLAYHNTGPGQIPGLIVQSITDDEGAVDRTVERIVTLVNANDEYAYPQVPELAGVELELHPIQRSSADPIVQLSSFDPATATFVVPGRTTAVFLGERSPTEQIELLIDDIDALEAAGVLNKGNANALRSKLENVLAKIDKGQIGAAINGLEAFINEVEALVAAGTLTEAQGAALIAAAEDAITALGG
jgi:hypothetical protein